MSDNRTAALDAYARFFSGFNSRDDAVWSSALHFPHVRVSPRAPPVIAADREHRTATNWDTLVATGWHHSVPITPQVLHESSNKVHLIGGWTRHRGDGAEILRNDVTYVVTRMGAHAAAKGEWGIQGRFGIDPGADGTTNVDAKVAEDLISDYLSLWDDHDFYGCAQLANYPLVDVDAGSLRVWADAAAFARALEQGPWHLITTRALRVLQAGPSAVNVALDVALDGGDRRELAVFMCTKRDAHWGIQARSIIDL